MDHNSSFKMPTAPIRKKNVICIEFITGNMLSPVISLV